jgi:hypothetical protein
MHRVWAPRHDVALAEATIDPVANALQRVSASRLGPALRAGGRRPASSRGALAVVATARRCSPRPNNRADRRSGSPPHHATRLLAVVAARSAGGCRSCSAEVDGASGSGHREPVTRRRPALRDSTAGRRRPARRAGRTCRTRGTPDRSALPTCALSRASATLRRGRDVPTIARFPCEWTEALIPASLSKSCDRPRREGHDRSLGVSDRLRRP